MNILDQIIAHKRQEVAERKAATPVGQLEQMPFFTRPRTSFQRALGARPPGIVAEFKRQSPSKGVINGDALSSEVGPAYEMAGAAALSILTDHQFFGGRAEDLLAARPLVAVPLLRKDFVVDEFQILEARAWGADVILLIAANLSPAEVRQLGQFAHSLGLEVLLEVHDLPELQNSLNPYVDVVGVNNRNLKNFEVSLAVSLGLADQIPANFAKISESGLSRAEDVAQLWAAGYRGFLVGENFMKTADPGLACRQFIAEILATLP